MSISGTSDAACEKPPIPGVVRVCEGSFGREEARVDQLVGQPMGLDRVWVLLHPHAVGFLLKKCNS